LSEGVLARKVLSCEGRPLLPAVERLREREESTDGRDCSALDGVLTLGVSTDGREPALLLLLAVDVARVRDVLTDNVEPWVGNGIGGEFCCEGAGLLRLKEEAKEREESRESLRGVALTASSSSF